MDRQNLYEFARMVRARREELGLTQSDVAEGVGLSQGWVAKMERGEIKSPRLGTIKKLAKVIKMDETDLIVAAKLAQDRQHARRFLLVDDLGLGEDPVRASLMEKLSRIRLSQDRIDSLEGALDRMLRQDRKTTGGIEEDLTRDIPRSDDRQ